MKNITCLFFLFVLASVVAKAQSFTGPALATTGSIITLTAVGESNPAPNTNNYYFTAITSISSVDYTVTSSDPNAIFDVGAVLVSGSTSLYGDTQTPTTFQVKVTNIYVTPIKLTFLIQTSYTNFSSQFVSQKVPYTITIYPSSSGGVSGATGTAPTGGGNNGGFGGTPAQIGAGPDGGYGGTLTNYLWRLQTGSNNQHFYTDNHSELVTLVNQMTGSGNTRHLVYLYEGSIGYVFKAQQTGTVGLHRYQKNGEHMYTIDQNEANSLANSGWTYEGDSGYVYSSLQPNTMPVYRYLAKSGSAGHFFTSDFNELGGGNSSWTYEGIGYYILSAPQ